MQTQLTTSSLQLNPSQPVKHYSSRNNCFEQTLMLTRRATMGCRLSPLSSLRQIVTTALKALVSLCAKLSLGQSKSLMQANTRQCCGFSPLVCSSAPGYTNVLAPHTTGRRDFAKLIPPGDVFHGRYRVWGTNHVDK